MKIIWYEDEEVAIQYFKKHIDPKLSQELAFFGWTHEYIKRDWDLISEKYAKDFEKGTKQIWIIDLKSTEMTKRRRPEIRKWLERWIAKPKDQLIIENLKQDSCEINMLGDWSGVILAIIARNYNIPFFYATANPGTLKNICTYLASGQKPTELTIPAQYTINKSLPDQLLIELKNKIGSKISNNGKSVSTLSREEWRIIRGVEKGVSERVNVANITAKTNVTADQIKTFLLKFHPHHCRGGGETDDDPLNMQPDKWSEYLFTPKMKEIFENLYYNINSCHDWYNFFSIWKPPIRALIQDDKPDDKSVELCLSSLFNEWKKQHENITIDYIRSNYIHKDKSHKAGGDYLWFNAVRLCRTLSTLINNRKNINAIKIYQIGTPELPDLDRVDNSGITCCIYMDDDADGDNNLYNKLFPSSKDHNGDINIDRECSMCKFCYELFLAGCDWIFYSRRKDNDNKLLFHILYPTAALFDIPYKIPSKCTDIIKSGSQSFVLPKNSIDKIPTLTFHIAPDIVKTSFRKRLYYAFVVRSSEYFVNLNNDQQRKLYENIIAVISKVTNGVFDEE